jgi:hypothetical protein
MFVRLTRAMRLKAGWLLALVYLLCVLAPGPSIVHGLGEGKTQHASDGHSYRDIAYLADETPDPANGQHDAPGAQCCGMVCLSALPTIIVDIVKPTAPTSICASENYRSVVDNAPPRLYRPPIA